MTYNTTHLCEDRATTLASLLDGLQRLQNSACDNSFAATTGSTRRGHISVETLIPEDPNPNTLSSVTPWACSLVNDSKLRVQDILGQLYLC